MYNHMGTLAWKYDSQDSYACNQYTKYPPKCTMHYVKTSVLRALAIDAIKAPGEDTGESSGSRRREKSDETGGASRENTC